MASLQSVRQNEHPVLFLDIDGVLHPGNGIETGLLCRAKALEEALSGLNVRIVVSSSWRFHMEIDEILCQLPTDIARRVVGVTGNPHIGQWPRFNEIRTWIGRNAKFADWRALDDARLEFPNPCQELIACDPRTGFGAKQAIALRTWLSGR
jgi:hypothetical protein